MSKTRQPKKAKVQDDDETEEVEKLERAPSSNEGLRHQKVIEMKKTELMRKKAKGFVLTKRNLNFTSQKNAFGIIKKVTLQNFMCHSNLTMNFESSVLFIVGNNGSGKSAILTGIIVGLGGKTVSTSRGTNLKDLIKDGCNTAIIKIVLKNTGDDRLEDEKYGDEITIERRITSEGSSTYRLKNQLQLISTKREDVMFVLDALNLHVDNPLTCLNQELTKSFLHSKSPNDKYRFFLKTTQLEQLSDDYKFITRKKDEYEEWIKKKERALPDLEKIVSEKDDLYRNLAMLSELRQRVSQLKHELAWSLVCQMEALVAPMSRDLKSNKEQEESCKGNLKKYKKLEEKATVGIVVWCCAVLCVSVAKL